jgi:hypothetical protein
MLPIYSSSTPECEGESIQDRKGASIIRIWYKGYEDVKEIQYN